ncbi:MAG: hypothetical protein AMXMBFR58_04330 [Phycisphaerae bacterium]|nr:hypothetical protein [Phycisphaerales bacterium]
MKDDQIVKIAKALADPTRLLILREIQAAGEMTCSRACELAPVSQPTISHHVKTLEEAGLITVRRDGQFHILRVDGDLLREFSSLLTNPGAAPSPARSGRARTRTAAKRPPATTARPARRRGRAT